MNLKIGNSPFARHNDTVFVANSFPSRGLCTCCSLCLQCSSSSSWHSWDLLLIQVSSRDSPSEAWEDFRDCKLKSPPSSLPAFPISHSLAPPPVDAAWYLKPSEITLFIVCLPSRNVNPRKAKILSVLFPAYGFMLLATMLHCLCTRMFTGRVLR